MFIVLGTMTTSKAFSQTTFKYNKISFLEGSEMNTSTRYENVLSTVTFYNTLIILTVPEEDFAVTYYIVDAINEDGNPAFTVYNYLDSDTKSYGYLSLTNGMVFYKKINSETVTMFHN